MRHHLPGCDRPGSCLDELCQANGKCVEFGPFRGGDTQHWFADFCLETRGDGSGVDLVHGHEMGPRAGAIEKVTFVWLESCFGIEDDQDDVCAIDGLARPFTCQTVEDVGRGCTYAGRVDQGNPVSSQEDLFRYRVTGRSGDVRHNDSGILEQGVHQRGLADVGRTGDNDRDAAMQPRGCLRVREQLLDICTCVCCKTSGSTHGACLVLLRELVGKVDRPLNGRKGFRDQAQYPAKGLRRIREQRFPGQGEFFVGPCVHEIPHRFGLQEGQLTCQQCPECELPWTGRLCPKFQAGCQNAVQNKRAPVQLQFDGILACVRMRAAHWQDDPLVQNFSARRATDASQVGHAVHKRGLAWGQLLGDCPGVRATESYNANAAAATGGGKSGNGGNVRHTPLPLPRELDDDPALWVTAFAVRSDTRVVLEGHVDDASRLGAHGLEHDRLFLTLDAQSGVDSHALQHLALAHDVPVDVDGDDAGGTLAVLVCDDVDDVLQGGQARLVPGEECAVSDEPGDVDVRVAVRICYLNLRVLVECLEEVDKELRDQLLSMFGKPHGIASYFFADFLTTGSGTGMSLVRRLMTRYCCPAENREKSAQYSARAILKPVSYTHLTLPTIYSV